MALKRNMTIFTTGFTLKSGLSHIVCPSVNLSIQFGTMTVFPGHICNYCFTVIAVNCSLSPIVKIIAVDCCSFSFYHVQAYFGCQCIGW